MPTDHSYYQNLIAISNRKLYTQPLFTQLADILACRPKACLLREKDLPADEYARLLRRAKMLCETYHVPLISRGNPEAAKRFDIHTLHLSFSELGQIPAVRGDFRTIGVSVHAAGEARAAEAAGADYLIAGHIFATDCKKGVPPRGLSFLEEVIASVTIPVYAIGGITKSNAQTVMDTGASGYCVMSGLASDSHHAGSAHRFEEYLNTPNR